MKDGLKNMLRTLSPVGGPIAFVVSIVAIVTLAVNILALIFVLLLWPVGAYMCHLETTSFEHRYLVLPAKCQVLVNEKWVNWNEYRGVIKDERRTVGGEHD